MIIARLLGGLGNQMFEYAFARRLALVNDTELKLDTTQFATAKVHTPRHYELGVFNIKEVFATPAEIKHFKKFAPRNGKFGALHNFFFADENKYVRQRGFGFNPQYMKLGPDAYLEGLWASEKYFSDIHGVLLEDFTLKSTDEYYQEILIDMNTTNSVSICFRRADFVNDPATAKHHGVTPLEYYYAAMKDIEAKIGDPVYFIFTDDPEWVKNNFKTDRPVRYVEHADNPAQGLVLMSKCAHNIIANSTFSWWGAWLNQNKSKIVYSPKRWFNVERDIKDLIPESWILL
jgi:Glycosyl transferase family 11